MIEIDWQTVLIAVIGGLLSGSGGAAIVAAIANRAPTAASAEKTEAEAAQIRAQTEISLADIYRADIAAMRSELAQVKVNQSTNITRITELESKNKEWEKNCADMQAQLATLQAERQEWKDGIDALIAQLKELEIKPVWVRKGGTRPLT